MTITTIRQAVPKFYLVTADSVRLDGVTELAQLEIIAPHYDNQVIDGSDSVITKEDCAKFLAVVPFGGSYTPYTLKQAKVIIKFLKSDTDESIRWLMRNDHIDYPSIKLVEVKPSFHSIPISKVK